MQSALSHSLTAAGFLVAAEIERTIDGETMEVDLVAYREGNLFLLECKNAFHPTDPHEMRTSYGHIEKAARQLGRSRKWLSSLEAQAKLFKELGWWASPTGQLHSCIVTANRLFTGYSLDGHPIRQAHELRMVLECGEITVGAESYRIWRSEEFGTADLIDYLGEAGISQDWVAAMHEHTIVARIAAGQRLAFRTFLLDTQLLAKITASKYSHLGTQQQDAPKE